MNFIKRYKKIVLVYLLNLILLTGIVYYYYVSFSIIPDKIPFFYTLPWGQNILADKDYLYILFSFSFIISTLSLIFSFYEHKKANYNLIKVYSFTTTCLNLILIFLIFRIINTVIITKPEIPELFKTIVFPASFAFIVTMISTPLVIKLAYRFRFIDDPLTHNHPAMLITKPVPRAGGFAFFLGVLIPALFLLPITTSQRLLGIFIGSTICVVTGLIDDRKDISPFVRLLIQGIAVLIVALAGIILVYVPNPFGESLKLDDFKIVINFLGEHKIHFLSVIASCIWMGWVMNFMSWANGTDGVYGGLVSISAITIAILMFVNIPLDKDLLPYAILASLVAGSGLAMSIFSWPPMKIMWGFGATAPALIIAALSVLGSTKVAVTLIVLMIPFLDAVFAVIRRISRGQLPVWGDREHLHHKFLDLGWSKSQIATFYWVSTILLALVGLLTKGQTRALSFLSLALLVIAGISAINIIRFRRLKKDNK